MKNLSKSRYTTFRQCPKALWLTVYKPNEAVIDDSLRARFEAGNVVGDLAMGYLGPFEEVTAHTPEGGLDLTGMIRRTQDAIARGVDNIAEASFSWQGNYCAVDILHKTAGGWAIYEVKSSSGTIDQPENDPEYIKYARDIAYQKYVLEQCGITVTGTFLVRIDKDYVRGKELDIKGLFYTVNLNDLVAEEYQVVSQMIADAKTVLAGEEPKIDIGMHCHDPYACAFWKYCTRHLPSPSVFGVYGGQGRGGFTFSKKLGYYRNGIINFEALRNENLGTIQNMQIECTLENKNHINPAGIRSFLDQLSYPLYFLDFETQQDAVPQYPGTRPYQQIPFQYSLHFIEKEGEKPEHKEFLGKGGKDPRRDIAESLCRDIPLNVCTLAYNKMFECGRLNELADTFPDLADHLRNISANIKDLIIPFRAGDCYLPAMGGSFSIKSVLPALFPNDPDLNYHNLSKLCQNGGDAMNLFPELGELEKKLPKQGYQLLEDNSIVIHDSMIRLSDIQPIIQKIDDIRKALLSYCKLDTLAMVKVWEKLNEYSMNTQ